MPAIDLTQCLSFVIGLGILFSLLLRRHKLSPATGGSLMAIGIFTLSVLPQLPLQALPDMQFIGYELLLLWTVLAACFLRICWTTGLGSCFQDPLASFNSGTWVAATALVAQVLLKYTAAWRPMLWLLALVALTLWLWFLPLAIRDIRKIAVDAGRLGVNGTVLLTTVTVQALVLLLHALLRQAVPGWVYALLILSGYGFYGYGICLVLQRLIRETHLDLASGWSDYNCILHGAMSITGLAAVVTGALPRWLVIATWRWAAGLFLAIEGIEIMRLVVRVHRKGWWRGAFVYNVAQWTRNFTYGMLYAFSLALKIDLHAGGMAAGGLDRLLGWITAFGQYPVLVLLLVECVVFFTSELKLHYQPGLQRLRR